MIEDEKDQIDNFGDLTVQPTGSGVADEQTAFRQAVVDEATAHDDAAPRDGDATDELPG